MCANIWLMLKLRLLYSNTWNHLTVSKIKKMSLGSFKNVYKMEIIIYGVAFYMPCDWLKKQLITGHYWHMCCIPTCARFLNLRSPSPFSTLELFVPDPGCPATMRHIRTWATKNSPIRSIWIYPVHPPKPHWTKEQLPGRRVKGKSAENPLPSFL